MTYKQTTIPSTVIPIQYIHSYSDPIFKHTISTYKFEKPFSRSWYEAREKLSSILYDICTDISTAVQHSPSRKHASQTQMYTSPPSTMFERKEKILDSVRELFQHISWRNGGRAARPIKWKKVFSIHRHYLKNHTAQHIGHGRKERLIQKDKYYIDTFFRLYIWFCVYVRHKKDIQIYIIDDIATTGSTLRDCSEQIRRYLELYKKKKPELRFEVQVFSIGH